ncbi:hypothetical protein YDYSY3_45950 [Paenibacillus chitinolyticus]|uniref:hypothetical protein n=1 Tax=Paenibacillus chitinolyticus TaxID=79263 RepID=UPI0026E4E40B|nr:hypothetical protein [Paenibacillus chitinolyticus]GKS13595.1 hypothetical protein YDYSY3_45950 [Paenibacillus chitinolyticus]
MQRIDPASREQIKPHIGRPVLVYLRDGTEIFGILSRLERGNLILNEKPGVKNLSPKTTKKIKVAKNGGKKSVRLVAEESQPVIAHPEGYSPLVLDRNFIAALIVLQ